MTAAAGLGTLAMVVLPAATATAAGNPNFDGILSASRPTGFPVSPQAAQMVSGGVTLNFNVDVKNLTSQSQTVALNFSVHHILTFNGKNVADGQPGQAGIAFAGPAGTTQALVPGTQAFSVTFAPQQQRSLHRTTTINTCGYFQIDIWAPERNPKTGARHRETLASGFTRVLGCKTPTPGPTPTPKPTPTPGPTPTPMPTAGGGGNGAGGAQAGTSPLTGGVQAAAISTPNTGAAMALPLGGLLTLLGAGLLGTGIRRRRTYS